MKVGDLVKFVPGHGRWSAGSRTRGTFIPPHNPYPNMIGVVTGRDIQGFFVFWSARDYTALMIGDKLEMVCESR